MFPQGHPVVLALTLLIVVNVNVCDALKCYECQTYSDGYVCGNPFSPYDATITECPEYGRGFESVCGTYTFRSIVDFWVGKKLTVRECSYRKVGGSYCKHGSECRECNNADLCNSDDYPLKEDME